MIVEEIEEQHMWQQAYADGSQKSFLQSWEYGEFLKIIGRTILRLEIKEKGKTVHQLQCIENKGSFGVHFLYLPHPQINSAYLHAYIAYAKKKGYTFLRIEPTNSLNHTNIQTTPTKNRQPHHTWVTDLTGDLEDVLKNMHSKTRYNIRLANKKGVRIEEKKDINLYWDIHEMTTKRNKLVSHDRAYCEALLSSSHCRQFTAYHEETPLASTIMLEINGVMYYLFGASSNEKRNYMGPYLLHWHMMNIAKKDNCHTYDWWGMAKKVEEETKNATCFHNFCWDKDDELNGVARFKAGFSGKHIAYPDAEEIILNKFKYTLHTLKNKIRNNKNIVGHQRQ